MRHVLDRWDDLRLDGAEGRCHRDPEVTGCTHCGHPAARHCEAGCLVIAHFLGIPEECRCPGYTDEIANGPQDPERAA